jgi:hypothetical protein
MAFKILPFSHHSYNRSTTIQYMCVSCGCLSENQVVNGVRVSSCRTISLRPRHSHRGGCGVESTRPARAPKKLPPKIIHRVITIQKLTTHMHNNSFYNVYRGPRYDEGNIEGDTIMLGPGQLRPRGYRLAQLAGLFLVKFSLYIGVKEDDFCRWLR